MLTQGVFVREESMGRVNECRTMLQRVLGWIIYHAGVEFHVPVILSVFQVSRHPSQVVLRPPFSSLSLFVCPYIRIGRDQVKERERHYPLSLDDDCADDIDSSYVGSAVRCLQGHGVSLSSSSRQSFLSLRLYLPMHHCSGWLALFKL